MKRKLAIITLTAAMLTTNVCAFAATTLKDIDTHWAKTRILELVADNTVSGYPDGSFQPDANITRAEAASILAKLLPDTDKKSDLKDVSDQWYAAAVNKAVAAGVLKGYEDATFRAQNNITREEFAQMIANYFTYLKLNYFNENISLVYTDSTEVSTWAKKAVDTLAFSGLMVGRDTGDLDPKATITRAEAVTILSKVKNKEMKQIPPFGARAGAVYSYDENNQLKVLKEGGPPVTYLNESFLEIKNGTLQYAFQFYINDERYLTIPKEAVKFEYDQFGLINAMYDKDDKKLVTDIPEGGFITALTDEDTDELLGKFAVVANDAKLIPLSDAQMPMDVKKGDAVFLEFQEEDDAVLVIWMERGKQFVRGYLPKAAIYPNYDKLKAGDKDTVFLAEDELKAVGFDIVRYAAVYDKKDGTAVDAIFAAIIFTIDEPSDQWVHIEYGNGATGWVKTDTLELLNRD